MYNYSLTLVILLSITSCVWSLHQHTGKSKVEVDQNSKHQTIRRQQVIHPLDEDKSTSKNDDDIEQYGKTLDSSGLLINKQTHKTGNTKDIIAKIKEIQDKIFKRTNGNNKVLEDELRLMSPTASLNKNVEINGERRKIIPEDVVDKILQKFQQLRSEAKNLALASAPDPESTKTKETSATAKDKASPINKEKASTQASTSPAAQAPTEPINPYASIEPPKESIELINRTHNDDVTPIGVPRVAESQQTGENRNPPELGENPGQQSLTDPKTGDIQIPIGNSASDAKSVPIAGGNSAPGVPIMFIKNGPNLIPVFNTPPQSMGGEGAQSIQQPLPLFTNQYETNRPPLNSPRVMPMMNNNGPMPNDYDNGPEGPAGGRQEVNYDVGPDSHSTGELIDRLINTPGFPQLASKLMSEGRVNYDQQQNWQPRWQPSESAHSRNLVPLSERDRTMQGMNQATVSFNMKNDFANNLPDQPSMLQDDGRRPDQHFEEVRKFLEKQPRPRADLVENNLHHGVGYNSQHDGRYVNDISDPGDDIESRFGSKSADELLDYAKFRSMGSYDSQAPPGSQVGVQPPSEHDLEATQRSEYYGNQRNREDKNYAKYMHEDPSTLLDDLHRSQLHGDLAGAGATPDDTLRPEEELDEQGHERHQIPLEPAPDDLMDRLVNFNKRMRQHQLQHRRELEFNSQHINQGFGQMDPSFADEIQGNNGLIQQFEVERKDIAAENDNQLLRSRSSGRSNSRHGALSVMSGDAVQFQTGQLSMDSNNIINSFKKENSYSRNNIGRPRFHRKHKRRFLHPYTRGVIEKPMSLTDDVELRVNGRPLTDNIQLRSSIIDGKVKPGKGKTLVSKDPVQIELSHGTDKRKIINIVTKGKYDVISDKKRHKIPHQPKDNLNKLNSL